MADEWNPEPDELMNELMGQVFAKLTQGDGKFLEDQRGFFSWATPGLPLTDDQFDFMDGFTGADEVESAKRFAKARDFASLVDFVPRVDGLFDEEQQVSVFDNGVGRLSDEYERVLRMCQVVDEPLSDAQQAKLEKFQGLLRTTRSETDIITDEVTEVTEDSALVKQYNECMAAYQAAALEYNSLRIDALAAVDGANARFAVNGEILGRSVRAALDRWETLGRRSDLDRIRGFIAQVTGRSMVLYKRNLVEEFERSKLTDPASNSAFNYCSLTPSGILRSDGWTRFSFDSSQHSSSSSTKTTEMSAGGGWGLSFSAKGSMSKKAVKKKLDTKDFSFSFDLTEAVISRPWCDSAFLASRGWRFSGNSEVLTDGQVPPQTGSLPAYAATVILVKNLELNLAELSDESSEISKQLSVGGKVGWGPFSLSGSYSRGSHTTEAKTEKTGQGILVPGAQIIGFRCNLLATEGESVPFPRTDVAEELWV